MSRTHIFRRLSASAVVSAALAGAVVLAGPGGNVTTGAQPQSQDGHIKLASASTPTDGMSYDLTNIGGGNAADRYDAIINFIRGRAGGWTLYQNIRLTRTSDDYFPLTLAVGQSQITLIFNARNGYVTGWRNDRTDVYYRLGAGPERLPGQNGATQNRNWLNYSQMEGAAQVDRGSLGITMGAIQGAISDLSWGNNRDQARALLVLVQALAEGARYDFISYRVSQAMRNSGIFHAGSSSAVNSGSGSQFWVSGIDLENNWGGLSQAAENATQNHFPVNYQIGSGAFTTMQAIDEQLALALYIKMG